MSLLALACLALQAPPLVPRVPSGEGRAERAAERPSDPAHVLTQEAESKRGLVAREPEACAGLTLFAPLRSTSTYLVDLAGEVVHRWSSAYPPGNSVYLLDDGTLLRCARMDNERFFGGGQGGRVERLAPDGALVWELDWSDERTMSHHDVEPLPNGDLLLIAWEGKSVEEALAAGRDPRYVGERGFWPDAVFQVRPTLPRGGEVVWEWHAWEHLIQDLDPSQANYGDVTAHPERIDLNGEWRDRPPLSAAERERERERLAQMKQLGYVGDDAREDGEDGADPGRAQHEPGRFEGDWLHTNAIDYDAEHDLVLLSVRSFDELWVIDHSTTSEQARGSSGGRYGKGGDLLWRWGNPRTYGAGGASERRLFAQHDAQWIEAGLPGAGHVLVFNNGEGREPPHSSVDELVLPFDPERGFLREPGRPFGPTELAWSYAAPEPERFFSSFISGAQRLPNGDTLVCEGAAGRIFEVTRDGRVVWDYLNPFGGEVPMQGKRPPRPPPPRAAGASAGGGPGGAPRGGPGGEPIPKGLFRATRIAPEHPGLVRLLEQAQARAR